MLAFMIDPLRSIGPLPSMLPKNASLFHLMPCQHKATRVRLTDAAEQCRRQRGEPLSDRLRFSGDPRPLLGSEADEAALDEVAAPVLQQLCGFVVLHPFGDGRE